MPFAVDPLSDILSTIRPTISTCTMLLIQMVITFIHATILPLIPPIPMHLIVQPSSGILPPIRPHIQPITGDLIIFPISIILAAISPYILPFPTFLPQLVIPFIPAPIHPCLHSIPMLQIIQPLSIVLCPVVVVVDPFPRCFVVFPFTLVHITIHMNEFALPVGLVPLPVPLVSGTIRPNLYTVALSHLPSPLTIIHDAILIAKRLSFLHWACCRGCWQWCAGFEVLLVIFGHTWSAGLTIGYGWDGLVIYCALVQAGCLPGVLSAFQQILHSLPICIIYKYLLRSMFLQNHPKKYIMLKSMYQSNNQSQQAQKINQLISQIDKMSSQSIRQQSLTCQNIITQVLDNHHISQMSRDSQKLLLYQLVLLMVEEATTSHQYGVDDLEHCFEVNKAVKFSASLKCVLEGMKVKLEEVLWGRAWKGDKMAKVYQSFAQFKLLLNDYQQHINNQPQPDNEALIEQLQHMLQKKQEKIASLTNKLQQCTLQEQSLEDLLQQLQIRNIELKQQLTTTKQTLTQLTQQLHFRDQQITNLQQQIQQLNHKVVMLEKVEGQILRQGRNRKISAKQNENNKPEQLQQLLLIQSLCIQAII